MLAGAAPAPAHGDPPLAYLQLESLYPAVADRPAPQLELQLLGLLNAAADRGYPIKVALVANVNDLADHPIMLRRPQLYASRLVTLLGGPSAFEAPVLVVTPNGFGVAGPGARSMRPLVAGLPAPAPGGDGLARSAMVAVRQIARAGGHALPARVAPATPVAPPSTSTGARDEATVDLKLLAALGAGALLLLVLLYEIRLRVAARRRARRGEVVSAD